MYHVPRPSFLHNMRLRHTNTRALAHLPEVVHERSKCLCKLALEAQRVRAIQICKVFPAEERLHKWHCMAEALQAAVHEARVPEVGQASQAGLLVGVLRCTAEGGWRGAWLEGIVPSIVL